jgi:hypothetical protein
MFMNHFHPNYFIVILCIKCFDTSKVLLIRMQVSKIYNKLSFFKKKKFFTVISGEGKKRVLRVYSLH